MCAATTSAAYKRSPLVYLPHVITVVIVSQASESESESTCITQGAKLDPQVDLHNVSLTTLWLWHNLAKHFDFESTRYDDRFIYTVDPNVL